VKISDESGVTITAAALLARYCPGSRTYCDTAWQGRRAHHDGLTLSGLTAADVVVAAVACEVEALDQLTRLSDVIEARLARRARPGLAVSWVVPTRYDGRRTLDKEVVEMLEQMHPGKVTTPVREAVSVHDAYTAGMPVSFYDPSSKRWFQ
jgi:chromosome partitioning protein